MPRAAPRPMKMYRKPPACVGGAGNGNPADCPTGAFSGQFPMPGATSRRMKTVARSQTGHSKGFVGF